jgi:uncharacterized membrane protein
VLGLPLHPLVVHGSVVLVPLATIAIVAAFAGRQWKGSIPLAVAAIAVLGAFFAILAVQSGSSLEDEVEDRAEATGREFETEDHAEAGNTARNLAIVLAIATVVAATARYTVPRAREFRIQAPILGATAALGIAASWFMFDAGHSGVVLVWEDPGNFVTGDGGGEDGNGADQIEKEDGDNDNDD